MATRPAKPAGLKVTYRKTAELVPYARNARVHTANQIAQIKGLIVEYGWTNPVLADADGIVAGHGRVIAANELYEAGKFLRLPNGEALPPGTVPVIDCSGWSSLQRRAYIIADNKSALNAGWDSTLLHLELADLVGEAFDMSLVGFTEVELAALLADAAALDPAEHWQGMPEASHEDETAMRQILVSFATQADVDHFARLLGLQLTPKTRYTWFPAQARDNLQDQDYAQAG